MAERKPAKKGTQQSAKRTTGKASKGFTDEERAAMKERVQELKAAGSIAAPQPVASRKRTLGLRFFTALANSHPFIPAPMPTSRDHHVKR